MSAQEIHKHLTIQFNSQWMKWTNNDAVFRNQLNGYCSKDTEQMINKQKLTPL